MYDFKAISEMLRFPTPGWPPWVGVRQAVEKVQNRPEMDDFESRHHSLDIVDSCSKVLQTAPPLHIDTKEGMQMNPSSFVALVTVEKLPKSDKYSPIR